MRRGQSPACKYLVPLPRTWTCFACVLSACVSISNTIFHFPLVFLLGALEPHSEAKRPRPVGKSNQNSAWPCVSLVLGHVPPWVAGRKRSGQAEGTQACYEMWDAPFGQTGPGKVRGSKLHCAAAVIGIAALAAVTEQGTVLRYSTWLAEVPPQNSHCSKATMQYVRCTRSKHGAMACNMAAPVFPFRTRSTRNSQSLAGGSEYLLRGGQTPVRCTAGPMYDTHTAIGDLAMYSTGSQVWRYHDKCLASRLWCVTQKDSQKEGSMRNRGIVESGTGDFGSQAGQARLECRGCAAAKHSGSARAWGVCARQGPGGFRRTKITYRLPPKPEKSLGPKRCFLHSGSVSPALRSFPQ